jgi:hypothetical protein
MSQTIEMPPVRPGAWLRNREPRTTLGVVYCLVAAIATVAYMAFRVPSTRVAESSTSGLVGGEAVFALLVVGFLIGAFRVSRRGLLVDSGGVTIRGYLRTVHVAAAQVDAFVPGAEYGRYGGGLLRQAYGVRLRRRDSREYFVRALHTGESSGARSTEAARQKWQPVCDELNALVASLR